MNNDLNYVEGGPHSTLRLTPDSDTPEILKKAITLMLFSKDPEIRNFNGESVVAAFPKMTNASLAGIYFNLTTAGKRIYELLHDEYPEVNNVYFEADDDDSTLRVTLNVELNNNNTETMVVYE